MMMEPLSVISLTSAIRSLDNALKTHLMTLDGLTEDTKAADVSADSETKNPVAEKLSNGSSRAETEIVVQPKRNSITKVMVRVVFTKIGVIDTIHDRYSAEVMIQSKWREPGLDGKKKSPEEVDWSEFWDPKLSIENVIGEARTSVSCGISYDVNGRATVCQTRKVNGQFFEYMELNQFPFDSQDLTVTVISDLDTNALDLIEDPNESSGINSRAFSAEQEWLLKPKLNLWKKTTTKTVNKNTVHFPCFCVAAKASRRPQFFLWNIIVIMMAICSMAFVSFSVALNVPQSRLQLTFILVLTTVTFKFVVNKSLPKISYLTYMDKYILGSMIILISICVWHAIVGSIIFSSLPKGSSTPSASSSSTTTTATSPSFQPTTLEDLPQISTVGGDYAASNNTLCPAASSSTSTPGTQCLLIDKIALIVFCSIYVLFHLTFLVLIIHAARSDDAPNVEETDGGGAGKADDD